MISIKYTCFTFNLTIKTESRKMKTEKKKKRNPVKCIQKNGFGAKSKTDFKGP